MREAIDRAVEECIREGILKGRKEGWQEGESLLARLVDLLQQDGRLQDLKLLSDETERKKLYREYHLADS